MIAAMKKQHETGIGGGLSGAKGNCKPVKIGVADYGMNVWDGGLLDTGQRLEALKAIGYDGLERLEASDSAQALHKAGMFRRLGMDFGTCRGPNPELSFEWTAAFGKDYVWLNAGDRNPEILYRTSNLMAEAAARWGLTAAMHNHLGSPVESQAEVEAFLEACPRCQLILDTAHLAGAGGDPMALLKKHAKRVHALHLKDFVYKDKSIGLDKWWERLRFCELGAGEMGKLNADVLNEAVRAGFTGWAFVEHDTHLRNPIEDLALSRAYVKRAGF